MKKIITISALIVFVITAIALWMYDIYCDRQNVVITTQKVPIYSNWKCGSNCGVDSEVGIIPAETELNVLRIKLGKDFKAMKVNFNDSNGWLFDNDKIKNIKNNRNK